MFFVKNANCAEISVMTRMDMMNLLSIAVKVHGQLQRKTPNGQYFLDEGSSFIALFVFQ
jgi:hypothetical protein